MSEDQVLKAPEDSGLGSNKHFVLFMCFLVYTFSFVDRQILVILAEPIKQEFELKDWQLGFLTGTAFALFYATLGIPIARLADRKSRVNIMAISLTIWSAMTALCAFTGNFLQLAAARIGVGVGEAGGGPPAVSLISGYFPQSQRGTAMGIYALGPTIGLLIGFVAGGWVNELYGWRAALLVVGLPGILLALFIKLILVEPPREATESAEDYPSFIESVKILWVIRSYRFVIFAAAASAFVIYGFMVWAPQYLIRTFEMSTGEVGTTIGLIAGIAGSVGIFAAGYLADKLATKDKRWLMWLPAITCFLFFPLMALFVFAETATMAIIWLIPAFAIVMASTGPTWAVMQSVSPPNLRAMAAAIYLLIVNLIGLGFGPQVIGIFSDVFAKAQYENSLGYAIAIGSSGIFLASLFYYTTARTLKKDLAAFDE